MNLIRFIFAVAMLSVSMAVCAADAETKVITLLVMNPNNGNIIKTGMRVHKDFPYEFCMSVYFPTQKERDSVDLSCYKFVTSRTVIKEDGSKMSESLYLMEDVGHSTKEKTE